MPIVVGPGITLGPGVSLTTPDNALGSVAVDNDDIVQSLTVADNAALDMGSSDFTIECWLYSTTTGGGIYRFVFSKKPTRFTTFGGVNLFFGGTDKPILYATTNGTSWTVNFGSTISAPLNQWNHLAVTRSGDTWTIWINGQSGGSRSVSGTVPDNSAAFGIATGSAAGGGDGVSGYISNFRVTKGVAVYTSTFTPPAGPLTATQSANVNGSPSAAITGTQTSLLLNTYYGAGFLTDSSTYNFTVTNNGGATASYLTPFA